MTSSWTRRLYKVSGIKPSKITHVGRVSGDRLAEANGVSEDQISKSTRCTASTCTDNCL